MAVKSLKVNFLQTGADQVKFSIDQVSAAVKQFGTKSANATVGLNDKSIAPKLTTLNTTLAGINKMKANATVGINDPTVAPKIADLQRKLDIIAQKKVLATADVNDSAGKAKLLMLSTQLTKLSRTVANPNITVAGTTTALAQIYRVDTALDKLSKKSAGIKIDAGSTGLPGTAAEAVTPDNTGTADALKELGIELASHKLADVNPRETAMDKLSSLEVLDKLSGLQKYLQLSKSVTTKVGEGAEGAEGAGTAAATATEGAGESAGEGGLSTSGVAIGLGGSLLATLLPALTPMVIGVGTALGGVLAAALVNKGFAAKLTAQLPIFEKILETATQPVVKAVDAMLPGIDKFAQSMGPELAQAFAASMPFLQMFVTVLEQAGKILLPAFTQSMKLMTPYIPQLTEGFVTLIKGVAQFIEIMGPEMQTSAILFDGFMKGMQIALNVLGVAIDYLTAIWHTAFELIQTTTSAVFDLVRGKFGEAWGVIKKFGSDVAGTFDTLRHVVSTALDNIGLAKFGHDIASTFDDARHIVANWADNMSTIITGAWGHVENVTSGALKNIANWATTGWDKVYTVTVDYWHNTLNFFTQIWGHIENVVTGSVKDIENWITTGWNSVYSNTARTWGTISNFFTSTWGHIENVTTGSVKSVENWVSTGWNTIYQDTAHIWSDIANFFSGSWNKLEQLASDGGTWIRNKVLAAWNLIKSDAVNIWNSISGFFVNEWHGIESTVENSADWVRNKLSAVWGLVKTDAKADWDAITSVIGSAFNAVKNIVMAPIKFVVDDIWDPFAGFINKALGVFGVKARLPTEKLATGGFLPGYAPGHDTIRAMLSPGEFVVRPEAVKAIGVDRLHALNSGYQQFNAPPRHYANGGAVPGDQQILMDAEQYKGHRYVWGGPSNPTSGWDCSSFVGYILGHDFGLRLPGGVSWNPNVHGPVASQYNTTPGFNLVSHSTADILPGDLLVENSGGHVGFGAGPNSMFSAYDTASGTLLTDAANMTNIYRYHGALSPNGPLSVIGGVLTTLAADALSGLTGLASGALNKIPGISTNPIAMLGKDVMLDAMNGAKNALTGNPNNYSQPAGSPGGGPGGNPVPGGATGSSMANGKELYSYLLTNLFGGHKIAAAGAIASIWGESTWNPFAQGTGGRGLIGWTPPGSISNSDFAGGMATQLPDIIRFVNNNGDMGTVRAMESATSILAAANLWGKGVERYGINDVHAEGLDLAAQIMGQSPTQIAAQTAAANTGAGSFNGYAYANGGMIPEPVMGRGLRSGSNYLFAENGPEWVVPQNRMVSSTANGGGDVYNITVAGDTDPDGAALRIQQKLRDLKRHRGGQSLGLD